MSSDVGEPQSVSWLLYRKVFERAPGNSQAKMRVSVCVCVCVCVCGDIISQRKTSSYTHTHRVLSVFFEIW